MNMKEELIKKAADDCWVKYRDQIDIKLYSSVFKDAFEIAIKWHSEINKKNKYESNH